MPVWEYKPYTEEGQVSETRFFRREQNAEILEVRHWALAVRGVQIAIKANGVSPGLIDGWFGIQTETALKNLQARLNVAQDGIWGPVTAKAALRKLINTEERANGIVGGYLCGMVKKESAFDLAAHAKTDIEDSFGLVQVNRLAHGEYSLEQIIDPQWNLRYAARRMRTAYDKYRTSGAGDALAWQCAIAQHNSPVAADQWYKARTPPNAKIADYVTAIQSGC